MGRDDQIRLPGGMPPDLMRCCGSLEHSANLSQLALGVSALERGCHGSVVVGEQGEGGDRLIVEGIGMDACPPPRLGGADLTSEAGLGCGLCLAGDPHGLPGFEVRALRVDGHRLSVVDVVSLQGGQRQPRSWWAVAQPSRSQRRAS